MRQFTTQCCRVINNMLYFTSYYAMQYPQHCGMSILSFLCTLCSYIRVSVGATYADDIRVCIMQLHTCASRFFSTPYSIITSPGLISSQLVATVTEIDGSGTTCSTSPGDSTISRMRQLTTQCCRVINNMLYFTSHYAMQYPQHCGVSILSFLCTLCSYIRVSVGATYADDIRVCIMQLHTCASRFFSTPYSIITSPGLISSQLVATVTEIDGSGTTCSTSPGDYTISRMRQLTTQCCRVINNMLYFTSHYAMQYPQHPQHCGVSILRFLCTLCSYIRVSVGATYADDICVCIMQLHTCASRFFSTPYSISTNPGLISSQLVATVTGIGGSGATCSTSLGDSTINRMRQLTTQCCRVINNMLRTMPCSTHSIVV